MRISQLIFPLAIATAIVGAAIYFIFPQFLSEPTSVERVSARIEKPDFPQKYEKREAPETLEAIPQQRHSRARVAPGMRQQNKERAIAYKWIDEHGQTHYGDQSGSIQENVEVNAVYSPSTFSVLPNRRLISPKDERQKAKSVRKPMNRYRAETREIDTGSRGMIAENSSRCRAAERKLDYIKSRMRAGYTASEADWLHRRELKARENRRRFCR